MKLGRLPAKRPIGLRLLSAYMVDEMPLAPLTFDSGAGVANWDILGNDEFGDCAWAGMVHLRMQAGASTQSTETYPTAQQVIQAYLHWTKGQDVGTVVADMLTAWHTTGLMETRIAGFAPVNYHDLEKLYSAAYVFDGLMLGVALPKVAQDEFPSGKWDLTNTGLDRVIEGGHCITLAGRVPGGAKIVTWGQEIIATDRWLETYLEEAWAVITPELVVHKGDGHGVDLDALQSDLAKAS